MAIEVFNRYEKKYQISAEIFAELQDRLPAYMNLDAHNAGRLTYTICSIYYDSPDSYLIRNSIAKPIYKEKLRLRSYGTPTAGSTVYAEIKKKFRGLSNKRRSGLKLMEAYDFLSTGNLPIHQPYMNGQVLRELQYLLSQRELHPAVYLSYERRAFFGDGSSASGSDLRISFDTGITTRRHDLRLESGSYGESLLPEGRWVMEIKTAQAIPLWLASLLSEYKIYPKGFSKYGAEYKASLASMAGHKAKPGAAAIFPVPSDGELVSQLARA